ncbi:MAG TPA: hypothetical protein PKA50_11120, partial [Gemmatimonadales bacterium]|nr:hypothetical protein [Gemmatimonadales bacterium]
MTFARSFPWLAAGRWSVWALLVAAVLAGPSSLRAQEDADPGSSGRRPVVTRAQLQQSLEAAEALANSDAYSASF